MNNNIHGIGELGSSNRGSNNNPFLGRAVDQGDPRNESFFKFIRDFCCPTFVFKSVIFFISIADLIIYIATLAYGIKLDPQELLAPKTITLDSFGMKV
jgi:hypothetical protein